MSFRQFRIAVLLVLLALTGGVTAYDNFVARGWREPLQLEIRPLVGDGSDTARRYAAGLSPADFTAIDAFLSREAQRYGFALAPALDLRVLPVGADLPPVPPHSSNGLAVAWWSLKLRLWSYRDSTHWLPRPGVVRMYVAFHTPADHLRLAHSLGLQKGLIGVVHAWADPRLASRNQVVIAHELLHTLGATDKYDPATNLPVFPDGYAEPGRSPRLPQYAAEIMAGRVPLARDRAEIPPSLDRAQIGALTAREIGFADAFSRHWSTP